jgi:hypothetical protein
LPFVSFLCFLPFVFSLLYHQQIWLFKDVSWILFLFIKRDLKHLHRFYLLLVLFFLSLQLPAFFSQHVLVFDIGILYTVLILQSYFECSSWDELSYRLYFSFTELSFFSLCFSILADAISDICIQQQAGRFFSIAYWLRCQPLFLIIFGWLISFFWSPFYFFQLLSGLKKKGFFFCLLSDVFIFAIHIGSFCTTGTCTCFTSMCFHFCFSLLFRWWISYSLFFSFRGFGSF